MSVPAHGQWPTVRCRASRPPAAAPTPTAAPCMDDVNGVTQTRRDFQGGAADVGPCMYALLLFEQLLWQSPAVRQLRQGSWLAGLMAGPAARWAGSTSLAPASASEGMHCVDTRWQ